MIHCPKCGFEQPEDQYCAKCGIDMSRVKVKAGPLTKKPAFIGVVALLVVVATVQVIRAVRSADRDDPFAFSGERRQLRAKLLKADVSPSERERIDANLMRHDTVPSSKLPAPAVRDDRPSPTESAAVTRGSGRTAGAIAQASSAGLAPPASPHLSAGTAVAPAAAAERKTAQSSTSVTFAWAEAATEWLTAMGSNEVGIHLIPDLESRLREARTAYRVINVSKSTITEQSGPIIVRKGSGEAAFQFTPHVENGPGGLAAISGALEFQLRRGIASRENLNPGLNSTIELNQGSGYIVRVNLPASQPEFETVVVILPR